jgi:hypothetical protein
MTDFGILTYFKLDKNELKQYKLGEDEEVILQDFELSYNQNAEFIKIHGGQYEIEDNSIMLDAHVRADNINDVISWLNKFNRKYGSILEINGDKNDSFDNDHTLSFNKTCYNIKVNFINNVNANVILNDNILSYRIKDNLLEVCLIASNISDCINWINSIGTIKNKLLIRKYNLG